MNWNVSESNYWGFSPGNWDLLVTRKPSNYGNGYSVLISWRFALRRDKLSRLRVSVAHYVLYCIMYM
jgi:hypothetical protein